ncbi:MAG: DEAD/DEAH box helicase [Anaerolineales bacterium]|nr:DEAD/DEAH box helicase [Anaerolineales bacterium]
MLVLHAHWQPPGAPADTGGVLFWAEMSEASQPGWQRGRLPKQPKPRQHPFCAPSQALYCALEHSASLASATEDQAVLRLPGTRTGPLPSPRLAHAWELDEQTPPFLAPWIVEGLRLPPAAALPVLLALSTERQNDGGAAWFILGDDINYWRTVATLALEALAAHKLLPVLAQADAERREFHARWLPVLDGPRDGPRMALLERAMPPVCRAQAAERGDLLSPRSLLTAFLNTTCDALARAWGRQAAPGASVYQGEPAGRWLRALFDPKPTIKAAPAQLQSLAASQQAWMRSLYIAGDATYRIAFRLVAPQQQAEQLVDDWQLHYLLQARDDPSLLVPADLVWKTRAGALNQLNRRFEQPQERLLAGLGYAARMFPPIAGSLKDKRPARLSLETQEAYAFLREAAPLLESAGFGLLVPPWWNKPGSRLGVRLRLKASKRGPGADVIPQGRLSFENLVDYEWELSLGDVKLTEQEFQALAALKSPLVQIRGQWVQLDPEQIEAAIQFWRKQELSGEIGLLEALQFGLGAEATQNGLPIDEVIPEGWLADWLGRLNRSQRLAELPQPAGLRGELRPYQRYGYSWLDFLRRWRLGACLADDMGLGKTIQTIALLLHEKEMLGSLPAPSLLVCPTSVVTNWEHEVRRFAPALETLIHQGAARLRGEEFVQAARSVDMVLTSYALARQDIEIMQSISWLGVILDEAQNIKNPSAKQTQAIRKLTADFRFALTGTPVENRLSELWSIMHFLNPGYLGSRQDFRSNFALPIERYGDQEATQQLKKIVGPFILRRVKTDPSVIQDLPEKIETKVYCHLTEEQATLYEAVVRDAMQQVEASEGIQRRGQVLSMLMQLKQICNHPLQYLHQGGKRDENAGGLSLSEASGRSGKLERLVEMLEEILAEGDRALIFTQFAEMGQLLSAYLPQATGGAAQFLHGGTPARLRDRMVSRFQEDELAPPIFILSLKAGGTGLNLTRASHVFHFDRWWNPAVEDQATDRAFRIGQVRNVQVHKFVSVGTMEEMIDEMIESKKGLAQAVVGSGEGWLTELSTDELRELITLRKQ